MSGTEKKGRRRFITRGEAVDIPHYERVEDLSATPGGVQPGQSPLNTTPPTPPTSRQPPHTPPSTKSRRRFERSPGSLSPSAATSRRRFSPSGSPSTPNRASALGTPPVQHPVQGDMNRYGLFGRDVAPSGGGPNLGRSVTAEGSGCYKHYPSYLDSRLAELDPTRSSSHRTSRRDSSSSESSIHGSLASLHSDGSLRESTPSYHESLLTPPRSPTDRQKLRSVNNRPRSWYDAQQLQGLGHISSESPTGFPFAASSYENLDKEGSTEKVLPRSSTIASLGAPKKDTLSHLVHARSFAGHEGRDSISPKPTSGSSPFLVAKHYPGGKSVSWQPPSSRTVDSEAGRAKFTSDSNVRRFFPEGAVLQTHRSRESPIMKIASAESDGSSVTSVPAVTSTRTFSTETQDLSMPTHRPVWDKATRDGSFDSSISEPVTLLQVNQREGEYVQHAPCKARPFGNRSQTIELSQIQQSRQGSSKKSRDKLLNKASISPSSVKEQVRKFDTRPDVVCPPCGVPVMPSGGRVSAEVAHYPVPSYKSATMPAKLFDVGDMDRRPSLPEQGERNVRYREQRLKELSALPSTVTSLPKRSQSIDVMGKNLSLFRSEAPSIGQDDMLIPTKTGSPRLMVSSQSSVTSSVSATISKPDSIPLDVAKSVLSIHKPSSLPAVTEASVSSSFVQTENGVSSSDMMTKTKSSDAASVQPMSPPPMLITSRSSSPETKSIDVAQLSDEVTSSSKAVTADSDQSAFRPFVKGDDHQILASSEDVGHLSVSGSSGVSAKTGSFAAVQSATIDKQSAVSARKSPLLSVKSPTHSSVVSTSHSSRGSSSTSPRHSPRPLELWATKQSSPIREYQDPSDDDDDDDGNDGEESGKSEKIKRGISQESIQSAMAVLDDAIAMLNSVAMDRSTGTVTAARTAAAAIVTVAAGRSDTGIDLSRSGLLKYSSQATGSKTLVTGHFASMPMPSGHSGVEASLMPVSTISPSAVSPLAHGDLYQAVTQLASSVHTVMSSSQAVSSLSPGTAGMPNLIMSLPAGSAVTDTAAIEPSPRKETDNDRCGVSSNHSTAINIQTTDQPIVHADTSPLDQILASIQQEEDKLCASALKMKQPEGSTTLTRKKQETVTKFKDRPFDRDKPLEEIEARRKMLIQDDSFNRSDSEPDISSMPLPRDSVILRHRYHIKEDESSSSDSSSPATPRLSPRVMRRHKKPGSDSSTVADVKKKKLLNIPGKHKSGKDLSGSDRPVIVSDGQSVNPQPYLVSTHGQPRDVSTSTGTYYSIPSTSQPSSSPLSNSPAVLPSSEVTWTTPPSTPQMPRMAMGTSLGQGSPSEVARPERPPRTYEPSGHEEGVYNVHAAVVGRPSSVGFQSDSSSMSSHRRRFRVREHEAAEDNLTPMSVRPGKKDKSLQRKSALNLPGPDGQDHRRKDSDPTSGSSGTRHTSLSPSRRHHSLSATTMTAAPTLTTTTGTTTTTTKHASKGGLFSLGKTSKKDGKPSALGALISQTAMLAPAVAQSHVVDDKKAVDKVLPSGASIGSPPLQAKHKESPPVTETQTTPPLDSTTKVKAITPVFSLSRDSPESVLQEQASFLYPDQTSGSEQVMSEPHTRGRCLSPPFGSHPPPTSEKTSSPLGVPLMGRQMLSKLPPQSGTITADQMSSGLRSDMHPPSSRSEIPQRADANVSSVSALPQSPVTMVTQPGSRAAFTSSSVVMAPTTSVVTKTTNQLPATSTVPASSKSGLPASGRPMSGLPLSGLSTAKSEEKVAKPIASPKLVKTTRLKPLSEAMPGLQRLPPKVLSSLPPTQQQLSEEPAASGKLTYQGTKQLAKQSGPQQQSHVPFISQQQHQEVETVMMSSQQIQQHQEQQKKEQLEQQRQGDGVMTAVDMLPRQQQKQHQQQVTKSVAKDDITHGSESEKHQLVENQQQQQKQQQQQQPPQPKHKQQPKQQQQPTEKEVQAENVRKTTDVREKKATSQTSKEAAQRQTIKSAAQQKTTAAAAQQKTSTAAAQQKISTVAPQQHAPKLTTPQQKMPGQQLKQKAAIAKTSFLKQKALISEVSPFAIAKAESPPLTLRVKEPPLDKLESETGPKVEPSYQQQRLEDKNKIKRASSVDEKAAKESSNVAQVMQSVQREDICSLTKMEPLHGSSLRRSASAPSHRLGVLRACVTSPDIIETKLVPLSAVDEVQKTTAKGDLESSQSEEDMELQTSPITPPTNSNDLAEKETSNEFMDDLNKPEDKQADEKALPKSKIDQSDATGIQSKKIADQSEPSIIPSEIKTDQSEVSGIQPEIEIEESELDSTQSEKELDNSELTVSQQEMGSDHSSAASSDPDAKISRSTPSNLQSENTAVSDISEQLPGVIQLLESATEISEQHSGSETDDTKRDVNHDDVTGDDEEEEEGGDGDDEEGIIPMSAPVTDKIAAWQKHLTQHPQQSASQAHRQAILRERRGHGIWSSGESVSEQVSVLTPITEEQKPEKADSRVDVSENSTEEGEDKVSVAQRIYQMENKLDEDRFTLTRPTSGFTTPRLKVIRQRGSPLKGAFTPHIQALQPTSPLATDERQLLDKLTKVADIAMVRDAAAERRKRFMQRHSGDRRRTQPVTLEEIREADSLESVSSFRAEVLRKSSLNIFCQDVEGSKDSLFIKKVKGQEVFPQHVKHERLKERHKDTARFKTLPVTQTELNEIPESDTLTISQRLSSVKTLRQKLEEIERMDSVEDVPDGKTEPKVTKSSEPKLDETCVIEREVQSSKSSLRTPGDKGSVSADAQSVPVIKEDHPLEFKGMALSSSSAMTTVSEHHQISADRLAKLDVPDDELDQLVEINYKQLSSHKKKKQQEMKTCDQASTNQRQDQVKSANHKVSSASVVSSQPQGISVFQESSPVRLERGKTMPSKLVSDSDKPASAAEKLLLGKRLEPSRSATQQTGRVSPVEEKLELSKASKRQDVVRTVDETRVVSVTSHQPEAPTDIQKGSAKVVTVASSIAKQPEKKVGEKKFEITRTHLVTVETKDEEINGAKLSGLVANLPKITKSSTSEAIASEVAHLPKVAKSSTSEAIASEVANLPKVAEVSTSEAIASKETSSEVKTRKNVVISQGESLKPDDKLQARPLAGLFDKQVDGEKLESAAGVDQDVSTTDTETTTEDELSKMSVSEKLQLFKRLDKTSKLSIDGDLKQRRKFAERKKKLARSQTLPITGDEVSGAREANGNEETTEITKSESNLEQVGNTVCDTSVSPDTGQGVRRGSAITLEEQKGGGKLALSGTSAEQQKQQSSSEQDKVGEDNEEDHLSKLSLAEKVRLFSEKKEQSPQKREAAIMRRKNRRLQSRFKTQSTDEPITSDEVEKARISPLVASLVKPPDSEILQSMSIRDQREFVAQWAEATLSDSGSRPGSRPSSRPSSMNLDEGKAGDDAQRAPAEDDSAGDDKKRKGILKTSETHIPEVRGILKHSPPSSDREVRSILKTEGASSDGESDRKPASILKHDVPHHDAEPADHPSILKKDSPQHEARPEAHGILKRDGIQVKKDGSSESKHSILKKDSPPHDAQHEIRGILKKDSFEAKSEPEKGVLKKRDSGGGVSELGMESIDSGTFVKKDINSNHAVTDDGEAALKHAEGIPERGALKKTSSIEVHMEQKGVLRKDSSSEPTKEQELKPALRTPVCATTGAEGTQDQSALVIKTESGTTATQKEAAVTKAVVQVKSRGRVKSDPDVPTTTTALLEASSSVGSSLSRSHSARVPGRRDSSTDDDSATSSEKMSWIKNDAVARRRLRKLEEKGGSTVRHSMTADLEQKLLNKNLGAKETEKDNEQTPSHRPLEKSRSSPEKTETLNDPQVVKLRDSKSKKPRPCSIADRVSMLKDSQEGWRTKVEEKDVTKFTVEGKLNMAGLSPKPDSPFLAKTRLPGTPGKFPLKRAQSSPNLLMKLSDSSSGDESDTQQTNKVKIIRPDDQGFKDFFESSAVDQTSIERIEVSIHDFDHLTAEANNRLSNVKKIRPHRRAAGSRNPLKTLAARDDLQEEYEEVRTDIAERELRRIKLEQITGTVHIAQEALAGLASKENFSNVQLRKTDSFGSSTPGSTNLPYKSLMLMQVKGRRHCQVRLVAPTAHSINSGDCFLLVTSDSIYIWQGEFSNVIERSRATELATTVYQKRDLGCKTNREPVLITEGKQTMTTSGQRFWEMLGGFGEYQPPGPAEEDELYEMYMAEATKIYGLKGDQLILLDTGFLPTYDLLSSKKVLVFDFGSEMYTWMGKQVSFNDRKKALHLAKQIWNKGYDYTECNINPLSPLSVEESSGLPMKSETRPEWTLFGKVTQNMETVLFREKFIDWPDAAKVIKVKGQDDEQEEETAELVPYDVTKMLPLDTKPVTMVLEGSNVGRGKFWTENDDGIQRGYEILTLGVEVFHILEYDHLKLDSESLGQFHDSDTYVIRWHLMISQSGLRNIRTQEMRHSVTGRERWAYFFWQGQYSTITEKGASALMTVELDEERGPQVRVTQGKEPPCFLQLFDGRMIVHKGKREDESTNTPGLWRLYIVRGEYPDECHLLEVPCKMSSLRSRASMILLNVKTGILHVWHGSKSATHTRQRAVSIGKALEKSCPPEVDLHKNVEIIMCEVSEGAEKSDFLAAMDTRERTYHCLMKDPTPQRHSARLFYMHSVCGQFVATEILNPSRNHENLCTPFPFSQEELYKSSQPGLFLIDNHHEVYLWQGWWPEETEQSDNVITGSSMSRFNVDRRLAIETTLNYCKEKNPELPPKAWLVYAGLEPARFTNLFPVWEVNEEARSSNMKEGKSEGEMTSLDKLLKKLTCTQYTFAELQVRPLPEGVDPLKIESYLVDSEFEEIIKMMKDEFYGLPAWKQNNIKKDVGLF